MLFRSLGGVSHIKSDIKRMQSAYSLVLNLAEIVCALVDITEGWQYVAKYLFAKCNNRF